MPKLLNLKDMTNSQIRANLDKIRNLSSYFTAMPDKGVQFKIRKAELEAELKSRQLPKSKAVNFNLKKGSLKNIKKY
jgi:hypothetical protein